MTDSIRRPLSEQDRLHYEAWVSGDPIGQIMLELDTALRAALARAEKAESMAECYKKAWVERVDQVIALRAEHERLRMSLGEVKRHCLCTRNVKGFDYGEAHRILGKPRMGARWLVPADLVDQALNPKEKL